MGIEDPESSIWYPLECGTCDGNDCSAKPRGATSCCPDAIPTDKNCGNIDERAPCHIKGILLVMFLYFSLNFFICISAVLYCYWSENHT